MVLDSETEKCECPAGMIWNENKKRCECPHCTFYDSKTKSCVEINNCGPDITKYVQSELERYGEWVDRLRNDLKKLPVWMRWGLSTCAFLRTAKVMGHSWVEGGYKSDTCPCGAETCQDTVTICKICLDDKGKREFTGNFIFGFTAAKFGYKKLTTWIGADFVEFFDFKPPEWLEPVEELCAMRYGWEIYHHLRGKINNMCLLMRGGKDHCLDNYYCKPCNEEPYKEYKKIYDTFNYECQEENK